MPNKHQSRSQKLEWHNEWRKVDDLLPYSKNPRQINDKQLDDLKRSFKKFNLVELPAIDTNGTIAAGHQRIRALQLLGRGQEEIEVRVPNRKLTKSEFKDYLLTSNRSGGTWDFSILKSDFDIDLLLTAGFDSTDLTNIFDDSISIEDDNWNEDAELKKIKKTDIKPGDLFALGPHRILCADALDPKSVEKLMNGNKAHMINDDIPYNISLDYSKGVGGKGAYGGKTNDHKTDKDYEVFVKTLMKNALSAAMPDCHVLFWCDERYVWLLQCLYKELGIDSKRLCIWLKDNASPTPAIAFNKVTEYAVYGTRGKPYLSDKVKNLTEVMNKEVATGNRLHDDIMDLLNIWLVKRLAGSDYTHPTEKSPTLHEKALRRCTRPGDIVLDLTAGSSSLLSACHQLKRRAFLCEIEPIFVQLALNRFSKTSNEKIKKLN
jgi:DNA modification methylase